MHTADTAGIRPAWLTEACPSWCCRNHDNQEFPADRMHLSPMTVVPVVERVRVRDSETGEIYPHAQAGEITAATVQTVGDHDVWIAVATLTQQIEVSLESAHRLHRELTELLNTLRPE